VLPVVQAFWHGRVTNMERLSAASFLAHGHEVHVYAFSELKGMPAGTHVRDAREILPPRSRWRSPVYRDSRGTFSNYSDEFRYKLLRDRGGWWIDLDMVCLQPFDFTDEYVFAMEPDETIGSGVIRVPAGSDLMTWTYERCISLGRKRRRWLITGPVLLREGVERFGLQKHARSPLVFMPIDWSEWTAFLDPQREWNFGPETRALHLWNSLWDKGGCDRDAAYSPSCLYEELKCRYL